MMSDHTTGGRRTTHRLTVTNRHRPVPRVVAVTLQGKSLAGFTAPNPGGHIKIAFGSDNCDRPTMRTYTPRRFDADRRELDVEFVLHGDGVASNWAATAQIGDELTVLGPGGNYRPEARSGTFVIAVDETAFPAAGTVVEALPVNTEIVALCEVAGERDERPLSPNHDVDISWLHRATSGFGPGALLFDAVKELPSDLDADWFVACEAGAMRRIRRHLRIDRRVEPGRLQTRGYWRQGATNHPDHDYGED